MDITPDLIRELLDYDPVLGALYWRERNLRPGLERIDKGWNSRFVGKQVAARKHRHGHLQIGLFCKNYMYHRVVWCHHHGCWPDGGLDHRDGDPSNNKIINLRLATPTQNMFNSKIRADNTSGHKGVSWSKQWNKWVVYIDVNGTRLTLGKSKSFDEACKIRLEAEVKYCGEFRRSSPLPAPAT